MVARMPTNMPTPHARTAMIAIAWPRRRNRSRTTFTSSALAESFTFSPYDVARRGRRRVAVDARDTSSGDVHHAMRHGRDRGVVSDHGGRGAELAVHPVKHFEDDFA